MVLQETQSDGFMQNEFTERGTTGKDKNEKAIARVTCEVRP